MEHSLPPINASTPWRTTAIVASTVAALELVVLLAIGIALIAGPVVARVRAAAAPAPVAVVKRHAPSAAKAKAKPKPAAPHPAKAHPILPRGKTSVLVLNGNGRTGEAASAAVLVRARGYPIGGVGDAERSDYGRSVVMYRPGREREARRLARDVGIRLVGPLDGMRPAELEGAQLALVVGRG